MSMMHLNGNLLCVIDSETTGLDPRRHDMIQFACIPVDEHLQVNSKYRPFIVDMKPQRIENIDFKALEVSGTHLADLRLRGTDPFDCADGFSRWFDNLNLAPGKKISPLGCNWPFDSGFMMEWLGPLTYDHIVDRRYRDVQTVALYLNDRAFYRGETIPYPKINLSYLAQILGVERNRHNAAEDCMTTLEVYRRLVSIVQSDMR
jgi:DNA polymerase III epsilon subunit-like protein